MVSQSRWNPGQLGSGSISRDSGWRGPIRTGANLLVILMQWPGSTFYDCGNKTGSMIPPKKEEKTSIGIWPCFRQSRQNWATLSGLHTPPPPGRGNRGEVSGSNLPPKLGSCGGAAHSTLVKTQYKRWLFFSFVCFARILGPSQKCVANPGGFQFRVELTLDPGRRLSPPPLPLQSSSRSPVSGTAMTPLTIHQERFLAFCDLFHKTL